LSFSDIMIIAWKSFAYYLLSITFLSISLPS
jgi:hypothetical protein